MGHISYATCSKARQVSSPDRGAELICRTFFSINGIVKQSTEPYTSTTIESAFLGRLVGAMVVIIHLVLVDHAVVSRTDRYTSTAGIIINFQSILVPCN